MGMRVYQRPNGPIKSSDEKDAAVFVFTLTYVATALFASLAFGIIAGKAWVGLLSLATFSGLPALHYGAKLYDLLEKGNDSDEG